MTNMTSHNISPLERVLEQRTLVPHLEEFVLGVLGPHLRFGQASLLRVAPLVAEFQEQRTQHPRDTKSQAEAEAGWEPGILAVEIHVGSDDATDVAYADVERDTDGSPV